MNEILESGILDILQSVGLIIASAMAIWGINSWRREARWKRKYELAEEVLACIYESYQAIKTIRNPIGYTGEGSSREKADNETPEETKIYNQAYVVQERYNQNKKPFEKLYTLKFRFSALYGRQYEKHFNQFAVALNEIFFAAQQIASIRLGHYGDDRQENNKIMIESRKILYGSFNKKDEFDEKIEVAIKEIEDKCRLVIGKIN
ncbi:hypothetical protein [Gelidibacter japonicus]|uniref:hypothetical protein n=1 Tax=Gelidibacter japonicus TaxID=1962232 RepID=UPI003A8D0DE6